LQYDFDTVLHTIEISKMIMWYIRLKI
jgi:hypothetical protein